MRLIAIKLFYFELFLLLAMNCELFAGRGDKAGTAAASELLLPIGAASIATGNSALATVTGIEALFINPAGLARSTFQTNAMFSHVSYFAGIGIDYAAGSTTLPDVASFGVSVKSLSFGKIPITTEDHPDGTGQFASPSNVIVSGAISRLVTDHIALGMSANLVFENMENVSATGIAFSGGLQYVGLGGVDGLSVGVAINNLGPAMKYDGDGLVRTGQVDDVLRQETTYKVEAALNELPSTIEVGLGYEPALSENEQVRFTTKFQDNNFSEDEYNFGVQFTHEKFLMFRFGYELGDKPEQGEFIFGSSAGMGISTEFNGINITIDYAYRTAKYFGGSHVITLIAGF